MPLTLQKNLHEWSHHFQILLLTILFFALKKTNISFEQINAASTDLGADLIVMGSHGASGIKEMFVGSNAEKVVRTSEVPVLVIKNEHETSYTNNMQELGAKG